MVLLIGAVVDALAKGCFCFWDAEMTGAFYETVCWILVLALFLM